MGSIVTPRKGDRPRPALIRHLRTQWEAARIFRLRPKKCCGILKAYHYTLQFIPTGYEDLHNPTVSLPHDHTYSLCSLTRHAFRDKSTPQYVHHARGLCSPNSQWDG